MKYNYSTKWVLQIVTALFLIPLTFWFIFQCISFQDYQYEEIHLFFKSYFNSFLFMGMMIIMLIHSKLGCETIIKDYVFSIQGEQIELGMMLLIPRFITGISGHAAWTGIFAYYIGLGSFYKKGKVFYPLMGWILASGLHGLWNATSGNTMISAGIALITFIGFIAYLYKASKTFPSKIV